MKKNGSKKTKMKVNWLLGDNDISLRLREDDHAIMENNVETEELLHQVYQNENLAAMVSEIETGGQTSPGVLFDEPAKFRNIRWTSEDLPPDQIKHFTLIPDYHLQTEADRPMVAKTPEGYFCLDGWDLVEIARTNGVTSILVDVDNIDAHSDEELCLRKMVLRLKTRGEAVYAEIIRNTRDIYQMLLYSNEGLKEFNHGGRRDKKPLDNNRETGAAEILAHRMRKDRDTVQKHRLHCKFLSNDSINLLIEKQAKKKFFEDIQTKKRALITQLTHKGKTAIEITEIISEFIVNAFEKSIAPKQEVVPPPSVPATPPPPESEVLSDDGDSGEAEREYTDNRSSDETVDSPKEPLTLEIIKDQVTTMTKKILDDVSKDISLADIRSRLEEELNVIMDLLSSIDSLNGRRE